jgi:Undecaprenyl-phosphate glucose phosphotransferase
VGEGVGLEKLIERIGWYPELGMQVHGVVVGKDSQAIAVAGRPVLGHYTDVSEIIRTVGADEVVISLPPSQSDDVERIIDLLKDEPLAIRVVPDVHPYAALGCHFDEFDGIPIVRINDTPVAGWGAVVKRVTDIVVSSTALMALSPVLLLIAIGVKLSSRGPVFYAQERMGLDGQKFNMFKFRSMRIDAEVHSGAVWARPKDDRCTPLGSFLRRTSLDELPQFWNVLRGDMSLVGPRPERPTFVQQFRSEIPHYMLRHKVRTGITGWAQVQGWRGNTSIARRIECDLFYIRNWSYGMDLKILLMTLWKGFVHKNAY